MTMLNETWREFDARRRRERRAGKLTLVLWTAGWALLGGGLGAYLMSLTR